MLAVVLSRNDFKEYDQIISLYTREEGRRDLLARGVKKITSKNAAHLEPGVVVKVGIAPGKEIDILTSVQIEEYFTTLRHSYYHSLGIMWLTQFVKQMFISPERDERVFSLIFSLLEFLQSLESVGQSPSPYILDAFVMRILNFLGFVPGLEQCVDCGQKRVGDTFFFSLSRGGITCTTCRAKGDSAQEKWFELNLTAIDAFQSLLTKPWKELSPFPREKNFYTLLHQCVFDFLRYHHEARVIDWQDLALLSNFFPHIPLQNNT